MTKKERKKDRERETSEMKRFIAATVPEHKGNNFYLKKNRSISVFVSVREKEREREEERIYRDRGFVPLPPQFFTCAKPRHPSQSEGSCSTWSALAQVISRGGNAQFNLGFWRVRVTSK